MRATYAVRRGRRYARRAAVLVSVALAVAATGHAARLSGQPPARDIRVILLTPRDNTATPGAADLAFATLAASVTDTLVVAAYGLDRPMVVVALVEAQARLDAPGAVRIVEHVPTAAPGSQGGGVPVNPLATAGISVTQRTGSTLMHDKFAVFGRHIVWTGSLNFTPQAFTRNFENVVVITSTALADAYRAEFDLMHQQRRFSTSKPTREPVHVTTDAGEVVAAFGPNGGAEALIISEIQAARTSIDVAAHELTRLSLARPLATAAAGGIRVRVLYDDGHQQAASAAAVALLCAAGAIVVEENVTGTLHHKYAIIDSPLAVTATPAFDAKPAVDGEPVVITGSANWTGNGMERNDENVVAIHSAEIAAIFARDFDALMDGRVVDLCPHVDDPLVKVFLPFLANAADTSIASDRAARITAAEGHLQSDRAIAPAHRATSR